MIFQMIKDEFNRLSKFEVFLYTFIFTWMIVGLYWAKMDVTSYRAYLVLEDHFIEWMQFVGLVIGALICFFRVYDMRNSRSKWFLFCTFILGCLFVFGAGEEISWGQRIFGIESSEFFMQHNKQFETNLHNMVVNGVSINKLVFGLLFTIGVLIYFLVVPVLYRKCAKIKTLVNKCAMPLPTLLQIGAYILVFILSEITAERRGEMLEFGGIFVFILMLLFPLNPEIYKKNEEV